MKLLCKKICAVMVICSACLFMAFPTQASVVGGITKGTGALYLALTSPVEWMTRSHIIEEQHITPQKYDSAFKDVVLITWSNHTVSDRWKDKPYLSEHDNGIIKLLTFGNAESLESLNAAYRMGCYVYPYSIFRYSYRTNSVSLMSTGLDAPSMLVYGASWILNLPQKLVNKIAYILDSDTSISIFCLLDLIPNVLMLAVEIPLAAVGTVAGAVIAFIFNPLDSLCSFLGMFYFLAMSIFTAVWDLGVGLLRLLPFI